MDILSPLSVIDDIFEKCGDPYKDSFGEREHYEKLLSNEAFVRRIPYLTSGALHAGSIPNNSLVRYRGIVQDVYNTEYFVGVYAHQGRGKLALSKYRDVLDCAPGGEAARTTGGQDMAMPMVDMNGPESRIMERHSLLCVPIPGESMWVKEYTCPSGQVQPHSQSLSHVQGQVKGATSSASKKREADGPSEDKEGMIVESDNSSHRQEDRVEFDDTSLPNPPTKAQRSVKFAIPEPQGTPIRAPEDPSFYLGVEKDGCACVAKVYDSSEDTFLLNDMLEMVGIYSLDGPVIGGADLEDEFGDVGMGDDVPWPASRVPRIHCLSIRKIKASFPLLASDISATATTTRRGSNEDKMAEDRVLEPETGTISKIGTTSSIILRQGVGAYGVGGAESVSPAGQDFMFARSQALAALTAAMHGDEVAAEYVLLSSISRVIRRTEGMLLGCLPLCLGGVARQDSCLERLQQVLQLFLPRCVVVDPSVSSLNEHDFQPSKDYESNYMLPSPLQLGVGTVVLLDERKLDDGALTDRGVRSAHALTSVVCKQELPIKFAYCDVRVTTDFPIIIISTTRGSAFDGHEAVPLPLQPSASTTVHCLPQDPAVLSAMQLWWATVRQLDTTMGPELVETAEKEFVLSRQQNSHLTQEDFSRWLTVSRLLAVSCGCVEVSSEHWERMKMLESQRMQRLSA